MDSSLGIIAVVLGSIALLLFLILKLKLHEVLALLLVSVIAGLAFGMSPAFVFETIEKGMGSTLGFLAVVIGVGSMFGEVMKISGGVQNLADTLYRKAGERNIIWTLGFIGILVAIPIYIEVCFIMFAPIIYRFARTGKRSLLYYAIPFLAGVVISYSTIPPAAGAMTGVVGLSADVGLVIIFSLVAAVPAMLVGGVLYGGFISKKIYIEVPKHMDPDLVEERKQEQELRKHHRTPSFLSVLLVFLLPLLLMIGRAACDFLLPEGNPVRQVMTLVGHPFGALMIVCVMAIYFFGIRGGFTADELRGVVDKALFPAGMISLVAGAGGAFGEILVESGVGDVIAGYAQYIGLPVLALAYITAAFIRVAQGSGTVAIVTTSVLMAPVVDAMGTAVSPAMRALMVTAIGFGAIMASHLNDSSYWITGKYFNMDEVTNLKVWTATTSIISLSGFAVCLAISLFV